MKRTLVVFGLTVLGTANLGLALSTALVALAGEPEPGPTRPEIRETLLAVVPTHPRFVEGGGSSSVDARRVAWAAVRRIARGAEPSAGAAFVYGRPRIVVLVDGLEGSGAYDNAGPPVFSPDGKRVAFAARAGKSWLVVVDGQEGTRHDEVSLASLALADARLAYGARDGRGWRMVVDGRPGPLYDEIGAARFSPDGSRLAYAARQGRHWHLVQGDQPGAPWDEIGTHDNIGFSSDGNVAYAARRSGKWHVVVGDQEGPPFDRILDGTPVLSPDGRRVAYGALRGKDAVAVVDGVAGPAWASFRAAPAFGPGGRVAYAADRGEGAFVVVDGVEHAAGDVVRGALAWMPDGRLAHIAQQNGRLRVMVDATEVAVGDGTWLEFSRLVADRQGLRAVLGRGNGVVTWELDLPAQQSPPP